VLCRSEPLAAGAAAAVDELSLKARQRPVLCVADVYRRNADGFPFPYLRSCLEPEALGREVGRLLKHQALTADAPRPQRAIPVELVVPTAAS
jgi:hypothetical protein